MTESILKIACFTGSSNWDLWNIRMQAILTEKGYYNVIINPNPANNANSNSFKELQLKALAFIRLAFANRPLL